MKHILSLILLFPLALNAMEISGDDENEIRPQSPVVQPAPQPDPRMSTHSIRLELKRLDNSDLRNVHFWQDGNTGTFYYVPWGYSMLQPTNIFGMIHQNSTKLPIKQKLVYRSTTADVSIESINATGVTIKYALNYDAWKNSLGGILDPLSYWFSHQKNGNITLPFGEEHTVHIEDASDTAQTNEYLAALTIKAIHRQNNQ